MEAKKIRISQTQINICKAIAAGDVERDQAKAEAEGIPFDYEAVKAQREQEMIVSYARELQRMQEWEETRDKAFQHVITDLITSTKLYNYIHDHVPNLKALRDMDPADVLKVDGYGKKTMEELKTLQDRLDSHRNIMPRLNKAIQAERHLRGFTNEHRDTIQTYKTLQRNVRSTERDLLQTWKYYVG